MKMNLKAVAIAVIFATILPLSLQAGARVYVKVQPPARKVVVVKPALPYKNAVWISGRWNWNGHKWVWQAGHWAKPRQGFVWISGHWNHDRNGWYYVSGHWKRA